MRRVWTGVETGGQADFEAFVATSGRSLLRTAWLLTGDHGHAEDVVQLALERTAQRWSRLSGEPEAYARRCVVNACTDRWRRRRARVAEVPLAPELSHGLATAVDASSTVVLRAALLDALRALPPRQRAVLVLRYFLDLDEAATAAALGVGVGTVKSSASRGLLRLREHAPELDPTGPPGNHPPRTAYSAQEGLA